MIVGKRGAEQPSEAPKKKRKTSSGDESDEVDDEDEVKIVHDDLDGIDTSNIIPRSRRRAAINSGLVRNTPPAKSTSSSSKSPSKAVAESNADKPRSKAISADDSDEEAEF